MCASLVGIVSFPSCLCFDILSPAEWAAVYDSDNKASKKQKAFHLILEGVERDRWCQGMMNEALLKSHEGNKSQASDLLKAAC